MAVSESYLAFVLEQLEGLRGVVIKRRFGGVGIQRAQPHWSGPEFLAPQLATSVGT